MGTFVGSILRAATRDLNKPLNILTFCFHERYQSMVCKTGHNFFALRGPELMDWNTKYATVPENYSFIRTDNFPADIDFDIILCPARMRFGKTRELSHQYHLPILFLEVFVPNSATSKDLIKKTKETVRGNLNVFLDDNSREIWGWGKAEKDYVIIKHGIDSDEYRPSNAARKSRILSVCNKWVERDWSHGYSLWKQATSGLPVYPLGDTPGVSKAVDLPDLIKAYQESSIYVNTTLEVSTPTAILEAMACGCAIVSTSTGNLKNIIKHEENGFLADTPEDMKKYLKILLNNNDLCKKFGAAARKTIIDDFPIKAFVERWDSAIKRAAEIPFTGV